MGAPLQGSTLRASVQSGGHLRIKGLRPQLRTRRIQMMFPLEGPQRKGAGCAGGGWGRRAAALLMLIAAGGVSLRLRRPARWARMH
jgi:hypothetical protein